jgi:hypothetical protein
MAHRLSFQWVIEQVLGRMKASHNRPGESLLSWIEAQFDIHLDIVLNATEDPDFLAVLIYVRLGAAAIIAALQRTNSPNRLSLGQIERDQALNVLGRLPELDP